MSWRSKGVPLVIFAIFIFQISAPMVSFPTEELSSNEALEAQSIGFTSGSGHDLEGDSITVDGKSWTVRGESILDYWETNVHSEISDGLLDMLVTEEGVGHSCSINGTSISMHTIHLDGSFDTLLIETLPNGSTVSDCAIGITNQDRIQIVYNVGDDLRLARLAEINAVYQQRTWHLRTIVEDSFNSGLTISLDSDSRTNIIYQDLDMALHHVWFNKAYWNHTILDDGPIGNDIEVVIDSDDMVHVVYTNSAEGEVRLIKFNETMETRQILTRGSTVGSAIGMDLDSNGIEQITYSKSDGLGNNTISLLRSLAGKDTGRIDPDAKWIITYDDDSAEGIVASGDLNGDGKDDLIYSDPDGNGTISVHYGTPDGPGDLADRILVGSLSDSMLGTALAIGDFNCDGLDDLASSEPGLGINNSGYISIRLGANSGISTNVWWEMNGSDDDNLGMSITSLGDVESDGCDDLAVVSDKMIEENVAQPTLSKNGMVTIYSGNQTAMIHHANITQTEAGTMFGRQIIGNGDINGDGYSDMVISNTGDKLSPTGYSSVEFFLGDITGMSTTPSDTHSVSTQGRLYGFEMAFVGDVHGDGYDDVLISELFASTTPYQSGKVHMWDGSMNGPIANWTTTGGYANALLGQTISAAGDINEDGFDDFLMMAPSSSKSGKVDLYLGSATGPRIDTQLFAQGATNEYVGLNILAGIDLNGDGMDEILYSSRDLTRGENFGPVLTIMSERDWEFIDFDFDQSVIGIDMSTPLRGSPCIMAMLSDSSLILLENTPDGTPSGRWVSRGLANADVAKMGISSAGKPLILYHSSSNLMTLSLTGNTAIESQLNAGTGLGMMMNSAIDSNGNQRLGHASTTYSSIFYTEETGTDFLTTTVRTNIDLLHPIGMHVDSNDLSRMVYVDDDDHMVRLATLNGTWDEVSILNTTIGDDFDTIWDGDDTLIFAQIAVSNNSTMLQIVEYKNNTTTITDLVQANLSSSFEITELDDLLIVSIMDSDKLTVFERLASGGNWSIAKELWLLGETEGHNLAIHGQLILFDANNTVQGLLIEDGAGSWVHYSMDIPDTNSSYDVFTTGSRWHATSTNELNQLVWTSGTINNTSIMHTPVVSTTFPAIITNSPVPLDMGEDGKLMFAYSQSSTNDFYAMRFVSDQDRDLVPDSHDDKPQLGNQWADSDFDGFGDNPLGPSPDACPSEIGYSIYDRNGCDDYDADGWSDLIDDCVNDDGTSWWGRYGCDDLDQDGWIDDGVYGDRYPTNWKQALDSDRDSFGDNHGPDCCDVTVLGELETNTPDVFPYNRKQWEDIDNDGYGDNESDLEFGDKCWWVQGFSWVDRLGCVDTDGDGVSDPSEIGTSREWNVDDGADLWPEDGTQWADSDGDGYGDNSSDNATLPDKYPTNPSAANDTDGDGYPNNWTALENGTNRAGLSLDNCPDKAGTSTSSVNNLGAVVPYYGCTDTDNDGREDSTDAFPEDPTQIADSDGDGWGDSLSGTDPDYCPYEFGVINGTNGIGCPIVGQAEDSDQDGVADEFDDCANTQIGEEVDTIGCSANQKDGDQDFVSDADDMCPDTPIGETVDSIGCSDSQKEVDSDEDGVFDPFDLCPDSNPELTIDDDGCNLAQKDTDGDGVNDLMDMCPGTELGIPVLPSNGCLDEAALAEDIDGDGYKGPYSYNPDNDTHEGDAFPLDSTQWHDMDGDGYGDSQISGANNSDDCPEEWGNSSMKSRLGCLDSDGDGYHDYLGDDKFPADGTQWEDADLDNWGDNPDGNDPDQCLNTGYAGDSTAQARINFGCSDKQFDSDNDGVNDFWDICPNTNTGADVYAKESTSPGCPVPIEETDDTGTDLIMGMEPLIFFGAIGGGGLIFVILLIFIISKSRGGDDFNFDDDWNDDEDEDDDDDDEFMSSVLGNSQSRGPSAAPARDRGRGPPSAGPGGPSRGPSQGPGGPSRGPSQGPGARGPGGPSRGPSQGPGARGPGGPSRGPSQGPGARGPGGPSRGPSQGPGARGPGGPSSPDPRGPARGKKVAKRKPISDDGKVRKAKVTIDPDLFTQQELGDRVAAVDWTKGALQDGESERTILMQLQTTGWSAPQSRAIIELSKK